MFEASISLGNLISIVMMVATAVTVVFVIRGDVVTEKEQRKGLTGRLERIEAELRQIAKDMERIVRQDERLNNAERRIEELERQNRRTRR